MKRWLARRSNRVALAMLLVLALIGTAYLILSRFARGSSGPSDALVRPPVLAASFARNGSAALVQNDRWLFVSDSQRTFRAVAEAPSGGYLEDPAWRSDGQDIAFTRYAALDAARSGQPPTDLRFTSEIWWADRNGNASPLIPNDPTSTRLSQPAWSPEGLIIFYVKETFFEEDGMKSLHREIDRFNSATGERAVIVAEGYAPNVSPDEKLLAYLNQADTGRTDLYVLDLRTRQSLRLTAGQFSSLTSPRFHHLANQSPSVPRRFSQTTWHLATQRQVS